MKIDLNYNLMGVDIKATLGDNNSRKLNDNTVSDLNFINNFQKEVELVAFNFIIANGYDYHQIRKEKKDLNSIFGDCFLYERFMDHIQEINFLIEKSNLIGKLNDELKSKLIDELIKIKKLIRSNYLHHDYMNEIPNKKIPITNYFSGLILVIVLLSLIVIFLF